MDRISSIEAYVRPNEVPWLAAAPAPRTPCKLARWQVNRVMAHIDANLDMKLCVETLAALAHLSVFHFGRVFRNTCGSSPYQFVIRRRVERAQDLLLTTRRSIGDIALECGMTDQAHLNRLFRALVGVSPGVWRRRTLAQHIEARCELYRAS